MTSPRLDGTGPDDAGPDDTVPGLHVERTSLAWTRSALSVLALAAVCLHVVPADRRTVLVVAVIAGVLATVLTGLRLRRRAPTPRPAPDVMSALLLTGSLLLVSVGALLATR